MISNSLGYGQLTPQPVVRSWANQRVAPPPHWSTGMRKQALPAPIHVMPMRQIAPNYQPAPAVRPSAWWRRPTQVTNYYATPPGVPPAAITQVQPSVATSPATPQLVVPPSMPAPQPDVSPSDATADMGPTQDAAAAATGAPGPGEGPPNEHPVHTWGRRIVIGLVVAGAAFGGYKLWKRHKAKGHNGHHPQAMHGARRRRSRRR